MTAQRLFKSVSIYLWLVFWFYPAQKEYKTFKFLGKKLPSLVNIALLLFTQCIFRCEALDTDGPSWAPHVECPSVNPPKRGTLHFLSLPSCLFISPSLIWGFTPSTVWRLRPLSEAALNFRSSFKRSVKKKKKKKSGLIPQIVADECWDASGLIVSLSQCNRSRPSPGEHEKDMMSSWFQRLVLCCVARKFQLRLSFLLWVIIWN